MPWWRGGGIPVKMDSVSGMLMTTFCSLHYPPLLFFALCCIVFTPIYYRVPELYTHAVGRGSFRCTVIRRAAPAAKAHRHHPYHIMIAAPCPARPADDLVAVRAWLRTSEGMQELLVVPRNPLEPHNDTLYVRILYSIQNFATTRHVHPRTSVKRGRT